jgi:hypothetical protein
MKLKELGSIHGSDKGGLGYLDIYQELFNPSWERVMELGVLHGNSLRIWRGFFPETTVIFGLDNNELVPEGCLTHLSEEEKKRFKIFIGNELDTKFMIDVGAQVIELDLLIDDASHGAPEQMSAFKTFAPRIRKGGMYIIEDLHIGVESLEKWWNEDYKTFLPTGMTPVELITCRETKLGVFRK